MDSTFVKFRTFRPLQALPCLRNVSRQAEQTTEYHFQGKYRQSERGLFFFQYTFSGYGIFKNQSGTHIIDAGKGFLCRNDDQRAEYYYPAKAQEPWKFIWFGFWGDATLELVNEITNNHGAVFTLPQDSALLEPFYSYDNMDGLTLDLDAASSARIVYDFLLGLVEHSAPSHSEDGHTIVAQKAMYYIRNNLNQDINATDLADYLGLSREHFTRIFKEQTGSTPYQYIIRQKMQRACRYLKESELTQKQIARKLAFSSVENFSRSFTKFMKLSPGKYRKHGAPVLE